MKLDFKEGKDTIATFRAVQISFDLYLLESYKYFKKIILTLVKKKLM